MEHQGTEGMERSSPTRWLAALLGFLMPGLGQVYNRQFRKGIHVNLLWYGTMWMTLFTVGRLEVAPFNLVLALLWFPCFYFWMTRDAFRTGRLPPPDAPDVWRRCLPYLVFVSLWLMEIPLHRALSDYNPWRVANVTGSSMERTLLDGDRVLVDTHAYGNRMPAPGDIVAFEHPVDREKSFLQRCIAVAGQTVAVKDGVVYVDGIRFDEPEGAQALPGQDFGPEVVPDGHFFAMGDHRLRSSDSRRWGTVPLDHLWGKVVQILIAMDADSGRIRLDWTGAVPD